jgi:predicted nucleic acid-binding Zn ribbon protein
MSVYCANCGAENEDEAVFCENCGTRLEQILGPEKRSRKKLVIAISGAAILVVLAVLAVFLVLYLNPGYQKPVKMLVQGINDMDGEQVLEAPYRGTDQEDDRIEAIGEDEALSWIQDKINENLNEGSTVKLKNMEVSCEVLEKVLYDNPEEWQEYHTEDQIYGSEDIDKVYKLRLRLTVQYDGKEESFVLKRAYAVKYNGKWSLHVRDILI